MIAPLRWHPRGLQRPRWYRKTKVTKGQWTLEQNTRNLSRTNLKWFLKFCFERKLQRSVEAFDWTRDLSIVSQNKRSLDCIPLIDADPHSRWDWIATPKGSASISGTEIWSHFFHIRYLGGGGVLRERFVAGWGGGINSIKKQIDDFQVGILNFPKLHCVRFHGLVCYVSFPLRNEVWEHFKHNS